jgi:hypothetical protein
MVVLGIKMRDFNKFKAKLIDLNCSNHQTNNVHNEDSMILIVLKGLFCFVLFYF